jgi:hypothetical protein
MSGTRPLPPGAEPTEAVQARVHRRLLIMLLAVVALPCSYLISTMVARNRPLRVEDCLPPGVSLQTRLAGDDAGSSVGERLHALGVKVQNGVLIDSDGVPIAFSTEGSEAGDGPAPPHGAAAPQGKLGVQNRFRVITIPKFDFARPSEAR